MKKKVIVLSCYGGGGHMSAAQAIKTYLPEYNVEIIDVLGEILAPLDPIYYITFKNYTGQNLYNVLLRNNYKRLVNILLYIGYFFLIIKKKFIYNILKKFIIQQQPAMVISVVPLINAILAQITYEHDIPYLIIPTDLDIRTFIRSLKPPFAHHFSIGIGFDYPEIRKQLTFNLQQSPHIKVLGFPIRSTFFEEKNKLSLQKYYNINPTLSTIMLVMGATGSVSTIAYVKELCTIHLPFHLIICIGRNKGLLAALQSWQFPEHITYTIIDSSTDIANIMAISDLCITKPGSVTCAETFYMNIPIFLDATSPALVWEEFNLFFTEQYKIGTIITDFSEINMQVTNFLLQQQHDALKKNLTQLEKKHFGVELKKIIAQQLAK